MQQGVEVEESAASSNVEREDVQQRDDLMQRGVEVEESAASSNVEREDVQQRDDLMQRGVKVEESAASSNVEDVQQRYDSMQKEIESLRKEQQLILRKVEELLQREQASVRNAFAGSAGAESEGVQSTSSANSSIHPCENCVLNNTLQEWKKLEELLRSIDLVNDRLTRALISSKAKGHDASCCLPRNLNIMLEKSAVRKEFENRVWKPDETFINYFYDKVVLGNRVPVTDGELLDHIVNGVPVSPLRDYMRVMCSKTMADGLNTLEDILFDARKDKKEVKEVNWGQEGAGPMSDSSTSTSTTSVPSAVPNTRYITTNIRRKMHDATVELRKNSRNETLHRRRSIPATDSTDEHLSKNNLKELVTSVASKDPDVQLQALRSLQMLLSSSRHPPTDQLIKNGILPILIHCFLQHDNPSLQLEALRVLTKIMNGRTPQTQEAVLAGTIAFFLHLLLSDQHNACEHAVGDLGKMIENCPVIRDYVISFGIVPLLLKLIRTDIPSSFLLTVARMMRNICRNNDSPPPIQTIKDILPALDLLLQRNNADILFHALQALCYLTEGGKEQIQLVIDSGVVPRLLSLFVNKDDHVQTAALRAVYNIVTGTDEQSQSVLNCDALAYFPDLLFHSKKHIRKRALLFISSITSHNQSQIQEVINAQLLPYIIHNLKNGELQKKAVYVISNLAKNGNKDQVVQMIQEGVLPLFYDLLSSKDTQVVQVVLDGIHSMLKLAGSHVDQLVNRIKECSGLDTIEALQNHENIEIYKLATDIIKRCFCKEA